MPKNCVHLKYEDRQKIEELVKDELLSLALIARKMNRAKNTITVEVRKNGGRYNYTADEAEKRSRTSRIRKREKLTVMNEKFRKEYNLKCRVENLEMQIEILIDKLKTMEKT